MTDAEIQARLDELYEGKRKLATGAARTHELMQMLGPAGRTAVAKGLAMCPWARRRAL